MNRERAGGVIRTSCGVVTWSESWSGMLPERGIDIGSSSMDRHGVLPVPAVYAIDRSGQIAYAFVEADYKVRLPADELLDVASALAAP